MGRYNTIVEIRRSIKVGRSGLEGTGGDSLSKCRVGLSGGLSGRGTHRWSKGVKVQGGEVWHTSGSEEGKRGQRGTEGERANARSVTPHCAHLPTRPTPKFELESQPRRFSSTRPPFYPLFSSRLVFAYSPSLW